MTFLLPLIGLILGIVAASYINNPLWSSLPVASALILYFSLIRKPYNPILAIKLNKFHRVWIVLLFGGVGMLTAWFHRPKTINGNLERYIAASVEVTDVKTIASGDILIAKVSHLYDQNGNVTDIHNLKITVSTDGFSTSKGDILFFPCRLSTIKDNENYRSQGYADRMKRNGILYTCRVSADAIKIKGHKSSLMSTSSAWRDKIEIVLEKSSLNRETCEFLVSILLGDKSFLDNEVKETFNNAGMAHVLALSGMHVAIIMGIILFLLFPLKLSRLHKTRYWIALSLVWVYTYFTGLAPSTVRASLMATFLVLALSIQRKNTSANALLASAFIILLVQPEALYDVGLQLSFLCVACILAFAGPLNTINQHTHPKLHAVNGAVLVSLVATLGTWVVVSYYFKRIPLLFLPANLLLLPLLPFYIAVAIAYTVACMFGIDLTFLAKILDLGYNLFITLTDRLSAFGNATISFQATFPVIILWLVGMLIFGYSMKRRKKLISMLTAVTFFIGSIFLIPTMSTSQPDGMIFQKKYSDISMAFYNADKENVISFPRNTVSRYIFKDTEIFSIDCINQLDSLAILMAKSKYQRKYLILGSGFKNKSLNDIKGIKKFDKIIVHPSIKKKKERELMIEAVDYGIRQIYSLRNNGALEINLVNGI
ncbi:MAG: ComEC/Rec2 family competence protein [Bacteroides sp.]|nr:ComEC/Rec2 family competence protein [Bacteroides sp.]